MAIPAEAMTGTEWQRLPPAARSAYVDGVIDAWVGLVLVQESLGNKDAGITVFAEVVTCLRDRLVGHDKILAAVEKYVEDQPGLRSKGHARHRLRRRRSLLPLGVLRQGPSAG